MRSEDLLKKVKEDHDRFKVILHGEESNVKLQPAIENVLLALKKLEDEIVKHPS